MNLIRLNGRMIDKEKISECRDKIDEIDSKILNLLEERFNLCEKIGEFKREERLPIEDLDREKMAIESRKERSNLNEDFVEKLFKNIFEESKRLQSQE